ncbi:hypothetical protein [Nostoc sp. TCL26-01]|uniref:hypothetical protein n=1 Tax=Nostoc sp. TCL26-01 TaxID=2576904 RepID=UPI0015B8CCA1|nr:hypothetical protein [Nostoc sp. TCL26-01]QLE54741.1 hypothetical protein FD725_03985 [Nostoc sp. TCL26-01]
MISCPCCSGLLLPHIRGSEVHWFCRHCWQDMPVFSLQTSVSLTEVITGKLSCRLQNREQADVNNYIAKRHTITRWKELEDIPA